MTDVLVRRAELPGGRVCDVRISGGVIAEVGAALRAPGGAQVVEATGGAVLPGLHDHHVHLYAAGAALGSVRVGPPAVEHRSELVEALVTADRDLTPGAWLRGIGYHESVAGPLDRHVLDAWVPGRPVRVQHRSGAQWILNSPGLDRLPPDLLAHPGVERSPEGDPTGRLTRMDRQLAQVVAPVELDLGAVGERALRSGITGMTDATPFGDARELDRLGEAKGSGRLVQRLTVMSAPGATFRPPGGLVLGPVKILLDDTLLPTLDDLEGMVADAHRGGRAVAVHCVTRLQAVLTIAALRQVGSVDGDRIEHGAVLPADAIPDLARLGITVVTNPGFVHERGDVYRREVEEGDLAELYRARSLDRAGVPLAAGTDVPFGPGDPWRVIRAATTRWTAAGEPLGPEETLSPRRALSLFLGHPDTPGRPRRVGRGQPGDLVVLRTPLREALRDPSPENVAACIVEDRLFDFR
jgi:predicted amidohydrolase YtcJ